MEHTDTNEITTTRKGVRADETLRQTAVEKYRTGTALRQIAAELGVHHSSVHRWAMQAAVTAREPRPEAPQAGRRPVSVRKPVERTAVDAYLAGMSSTRAAQIAGVSPQTFVTRLREAGETPRPRGPVPTPLSQREKAAVEAYVAGATAAQVAARFGVVPNTVLGWVRKAGLEARPRGRGPAPQPLTEAQRAAVAAYEAGGSSTVIARQFSVSENTVLAWVRKAGVPVRLSGATRRLAPGAAERRRARSLRSLKYRNGRRRARR